MRLRTNYTGWMTDTAATTAGGDAVQRGDGLEMRYETLTAGSRGSYDLSARFFSLTQTLSLGYALRFDKGESSQHRLRSVTAIPYLCVFDDEFAIANLAGWIRAQIRPFERLTLRGGVRVDGFAFGVTDLNQSTADREGEREPNLGDLDELQAKLPSLRQLEEISEKLDEILEKQRKIKRLDG
jgi:hypothetical protein